MFSFANLALGIGLIAIGVLMLKYNYQLVNMTGSQDWIERYIGSGSTYLAYKLFAIICVLGGVILAAGLGHGVFGWLLSPLHGLFQGLSSNKSSG